MNPETDQGEEGEGEEEEEGFMWKPLLFGMMIRGRVGGADEAFDESPRWDLAWFMRESRRVSGPKAKRIISFSPGSCMKMKPMIFEAFSGSKLWILENTVFVASLESMVMRERERVGERE